MSGTDVDDEVVCDDCGKRFFESDEGGQNETSGDHFCDACYESWKFRCPKCGYRTEDDTAGDECESPGCDGIMQAH